jgi:glucokinase
MVGLPRPAARPTTPSTWWPSRAPRRASPSTGTTSPTSRAWCRCWRASIPTASADVNHFHAAGGLGFLIRELLDAGLLHFRAGGRHAPAAGQPRPRRRQGLGRGARAPVIRAPARVFDSQDALLEAFKAGSLTGDFVAVIRGQGPRANGMPELHKLTPTLVGAAGPGPARRAADRRAHVGRLRVRCWRPSTWCPRRPGRAPSAGCATATRSPSTPSAANSAWLEDGALAARVPRRWISAAAPVRLRSRAVRLMRSNAGTAEQGACTLFARTDMRALVADIGGTNARFALADLDEPIPDPAPPRNRCRPRSSPACSTPPSTTSRSSTQAPRHAAFAVACPVRADEVRLTNRAWSFSRLELQRALALEHLLVLNDFGAAAWTVPTLSESDSVPIYGPPELAADGPDQRARAGHRPGRGAAGGRRSTSAGAWWRPRAATSASRRTAPRSAPSPTGSPHGMAASRMSALLCGMGLSQIDAALSRRKPGKQDTPTCKLRPRQTSSPPRWKVTTCRRGRPWRVSAPSSAAWPATPRSCMAPAR